MTKFSHLVAPLTLWLCVSVIIRYGYYGDCRIVLGPNTSRLLKVSSVFVENIRVRDRAQQGILLYGFLEKPELTEEVTWTVSNQLFVEEYRTQGFSFWLNSGSSIRMRWGADNGSFLGLKVALIKGVQRLDVLQEDVTKHKYSGLSSTDGDGEAEYLVKEDNYYYIGVVNLNPQSVMVSMNVDISSKTYDTSKAITNCTMASGLCEFDLPFPRATYVVLTIPSGSNNTQINAWNIEISFVARVVAYVLILGFIVAIICVILKYLGGSLTETNTTTMTTPQPPPPPPTTTTDTVAAEETSPLLGEKSLPRTYGTREDPELGLCENSSEDLLDGKMCVICYDERRNSFFIPCGHCATCYTCAQRIMEGENKVCPICRRLIRKLRRLFSP